MEDRLKRILDLVGACLALALCLPLCAAVGLGIACAGGGPVLFRQQRIGRHGRPFRILKFRTLPASGGRPGPLGRLLRRTSLDELPQLWNVLRGEMSLVGPRPQLALHLPPGDSTFARRHDCLPGITGLAQVSGRNLLSWRRRFELDLEYVTQRSLGLDLAILLRTLPVVLLQIGASATPAPPARACHPAPPLAPPLEEAA